MTEYKVTFSEKLVISLVDGISGEEELVRPSGEGWGIVDSTFIKDTSQIAWVWKKDEGPQFVKVDNSDLGYMTRSVDRRDLQQINTKEDEIVSLSIRLKPGSSGVIIPRSFGALMTSAKHVIARLYCNDCPLIGSGLWEDYGTYSQVIRNPDEELPASGLHLSTVFVNQNNRSAKEELEGFRLTDESKSFYITVESFAKEIDVTTFITWGEKHV